MTSKISYFSSICCNIVAKSDISVSVGVMILILGSGPVLARGLPQVRLLWRQAGWGGALSLHQGQPPPLQEGLSPAVRLHRLLRRLQQSDPRLRDGDESQDQRLPPGVLRLPAVWPQVRHRHLNTTPPTLSLSGSVWATSSISTRTRSSVGQTTRRGCCSPTSTTTQTVLLKLRITLGCCLLLHNLPTLLPPPPPLPQVQPPTVIQDTATPPTARPRPAPPCPSVGISTLYLPSPRSSLSVKGPPSRCDQRAERILQRNF